MRAHPMNMPIQGESTHQAGRISSTLQAILQLSDGEMESIAAPIPLPEAIVRLQSFEAAVGALRLMERRFRRARSSDSVIRYVEIGGSAAPADGAAPRRCARCGRLTTTYYVPTLGAEASVTAETAAYCDECYAAAIA